MRRDYGADYGTVYGCGNNSYRKHGVVASPPLPHPAHVDPMRPARRGRRTGAGAHGRAPTPHHTHAPRHVCLFLSLFACGWCSPNMCHLKKFSGSRPFSGQKGYGMDKSEYRLPPIEEYESMLPGDTKWFHQVYPRSYAPAWEETVCPYCGNASGERDVRGGCISCGAPQECPV